jgi:hypothetical protein
MSREFLPRLGTVLLLLLGLGLAYPAPASSQRSDTGVTMTVTPYLGGHVKYGEWLPLRIHLSNYGDDLTAEARAEIADSGGQAVYAAAVPLPAGARKEIDLYILPPNFAQTVTVRLVSDDETLAETQVDVSPHPQNEYLIAVVAADADAFALLNGLTLPSRLLTKLIPLSLDGLPERVEALRSLDSLILAGVDTSSLTPAQGQALRAWVELGGQLLVGGGASARRTLAGLTDLLRPIQLGSAVELATLDGLADFADAPVAIPGPFVATFPTDYQGRSVIRQDQQPLLVQRTLGEGWVAYLALDPSASPFNAWPGALSFWQRLFEPGSALPINVPSDIPRRALEAEQMGYALSNLPALDLPSIRWLGLLFSLYVLLVGPANYLFLRRLHRLDWAWLTIPALTLAFSLISYGLGYRLRGSDVIVNQISVISLSPEGGRPLARSYVGIFSPSRQDYDVQVGGDALISPLSQNWQVWKSSMPSTSGYLDVLQGNPALVRKLGINQWSMQSFQAEAGADTGELSLDAGLTVEGDQVRGTIHNGLGRPLQEVILLSGYRYALLGDWDVGEAKDIETTLQGGDGRMSFPWVLFEHAFQGPGSPSREVILRQSILEAYFHTNWGAPTVPSGDLMLLAWTDLSPFEVRITNVRAAPLQTTLVVASLPLPVVNGRVSLPPGHLSARLVQVEGQAGECGPSGQVHIAQGRAVLEYQLPPTLHGLEPITLTVHPAVEGMATVQLPALSLYDWVAGDWVELGDVEVGRGHQVADPGRFMDPVGGTVRLQAQHDSMEGWCYCFDLGIEGELRNR